MYRRVRAGATVVAAGPGAAPRPRRTDAPALAALPAGRGRVLRLRKARGARAVQGTGMGSRRSVIDRCRGLVGSIGRGAGLLLPPCLSCGSMHGSAVCPPRRPYRGWAPLPPCAQADSILVPNHQLPASLVFPPDATRPRHQLPPCMVDTWTRMSTSHVRLHAPPSTVLLLLDLLV